jgi:hypothetical protein
VQGAFCWAETQMPGLLVILWKRDGLLQWCRDGASKHVLNVHDKEEERGVVAGEGTN